MVTNITGKAVVDESCIYNSGYRSYWSARPLGEDRWLYFYSSTVMQTEGLSIEGNAALLNVLYTAIHLHRIYVCTI